MNRRQLLLTLGLGALATTATLARRQSDSRPPRIITTKDSAYPSYGDGHVKWEPDAIK